MDDEISATRVVIQRSRPADVTHLLALAQEYCLADHHEFDVEATRRALIPLLDSDRHGAIWTIHTRDDDRPAGYACVTWGYSIEGGGPEAHNADGRRLYERLGFTTEDSVWMSLDWRHDQNT